MLKTMKKGIGVWWMFPLIRAAVLRPSKETTHTDPTYTVDGIVHYAVSNMPGALPRTSTLALNNATLPYAVEIANKGWQQGHAGKSWN